MPSVCAVLAHWLAICSLICRGELRSSHMVSTLLSTTNLAPSPPSMAPMCSRQIARSDLVTPVSAARMNTAPCAWGIRLTVSSGSAPMAFRPGVSSTTKPCLSRGCAMLISAWRQRGTSTLPWSSSGGLSSGASSCQKPRARASSTVTVRVSETFSIAPASCCGSFTSRSTRVHFSGTCRHSSRAWGCSRVSMGSRRRQGGTEAS